MLKILTNPNPILRRKSQPVADVSASEIQELIPQMIELMLKKDGVGLAAPQVGQSIRLIVVHLKDETLAIINPKVIKRSIIKKWGEEGCLSVPGQYGEVKRCQKITVKYLDAKGKPKQIVAEGLLARVIQHENDHLDGILFIDKARKLTEPE
jgi:peptide deformylase